MEPKTYCLYNEAWFTVSVAYSHSFGICIDYGLAITSLSKLFHARLGRVRRLRMIVHKLFEKILITGN